MYVLPCLVYVGLGGLILKTNITVCVNTEVKDWFRGKPFNISELCNDALIKLISEHEGKPIEEQKAALILPRAIKAPATNYPAFEFDLRKCAAYLREHGDTVQNYMALLRGMQEKWNLSARQFRKALKEILKEAVSMPSEEKTVPLVSQ